MTYSVRVTRLTTGLQEDGEQTFEASSVIVADNGLLDIATADGSASFEDMSWASVTIVRDLGR